MATEIRKACPSKLVDACARLAKAAEVAVRNNSFDMGQFSAVEIMRSLS